jgi:nitronate monooxygenase
MTSGAHVLAAQAMGADLAYIGTRFIATEEAHALPEYKKMLIDTNAKDIVYSSLFTGVHGNYLKPAIAANGLDPDNLPSADKSTMNFGSGGNSAAKAWRDIWSAGQGVGNIDDAPTTATLVSRMRQEYDSAFEAIAKA